jgi:hypothetical protein
MVFLVAWLIATYVPSSARGTFAVYFRKTIPMKPIAAEANSPNQLKIKWGLEGTTINRLFET